jgi:hypothetical protein
LQASLSAHPGAAPFGRAVLVHAPLEHVSTVHGLPSSQFVSVLHVLVTQPPLTGLQTCPAGQGFSAP